MKRLKLFLCLMTMTVGLSTTQLQTNAASEKTGIEVNAAQDSEKTKGAPVESKTADKDAESKVGTQLSGVQATTQNAKTAVYDAGLYPNATYKFSGAGLLHVYTNNKTAPVYLTNSSGTIIDQGYADSDNGYHVTFSVAKGTYKLGIEKYDYLDDGVRFTGKTEYPSFTPSKNSSVTRSDMMYYTSTYYVKIKAKKTGVLYVKPSNRSMKLCLVNSKKKALTNEEYFYTTETAAYGIKKGATYYLKVTGYEIKYNLKFSVIKEKSGSKKSKAVKLRKKNKWSYGTLLAGSGTTDWYKIKLTKKSKLKVYLRPNTTDGMKISVYGPNGKKWGSTETISEYYNGTTQPFQLYTYRGSSKNYKIGKGTYYIKIQRASKKSTGTYSIKWKTK